MPFQDFDSGYYEKLRQGEPETERHFVEYFAPLLLAKLRRRLRSAALVDEALQETFLRSFCAIHADGVRRPEHLGAFVHAVCENVVREKLRSEKKTHLNDDGEADRWPGNLPSPESQLITRERKQIVHSILCKIPLRDQQILKALFFEERDKDEVCRALGVDRGYLRVLLHRAKSQFRAFLEKEGAPAL